MPGFVCTEVLLPTLMTYRFGVFWGSCSAWVLVAHVQSCCGTSWPRPWRWVNGCWQGLFECRKSAVRITYAHVIRRESGAPSAGMPFARAIVRHAHLQFAPHGGDSWSFAMGTYVCF